MMSTADLLPFFYWQKMNQNQLALEAAIMELTNWVAQRGAVEEAANVRGALDTLIKNEEFINMTWDADGARVKFAVRFVS